MSKYLLVLVSGLVAVMLLHNLEDYLVQTPTLSDNTDYVAVDYYLTDFSLSAVGADGTISHTLEGQYLSYSRDTRSSTILSPRLASQAQTSTAQPSAAPDSAASYNHEMTLSAAEALLNHRDNSMELKGKVHLQASAPDSPPFELDTESLHYRFAEKHISTDQYVSLSTPELHLQGTGLDAKLDEAYLRLNANVKSTYQTVR